MDRTRAARGAVVAGIATVAIVAWFASLAPVACDGVPVAPGSALGAFQMARSQAALDLAIGCTERLAVLNLMNRVDLIAFIGTWGLFLTFATLALAHGRLRRLALLLVAAAVIGDIVETADQLWIGANWPFVTTPMLQWLAAGSTMKWAGIALALGAIGASAGRERGGATRWLGVAVAVFGMLGLAVFVAAPSPPFTGIAFLLLIGACGLNARRGQAPDIRPTASR